MNVFQEIFSQIFYVLNFNFDIFGFSINLLAILIFIILGTFLLMLVDRFIN